QILLATRSRSPASKSELGQPDKMSRHSSQTGGHLNTTLPVAGSPKRCGSPCSLLSPTTKLSEERRHGSALPARTQILAGSRKAELYRRRTRDLRIRAPCGRGCIQADNGAVPRPGSRAWRDKSPADDR